MVRNGILCSLFLIIVEIFFWFTHMYVLCLLLQSLEFIRISVLLCEEDAISLESPTTSGDFFFFLVFQLTHRNRSLDFEWRNLIKTFYLGHIQSHGVGLKSK